MARVLVVDDESGGPLDIIDTLEDLGYLSLRAKSASQALDLAGQEQPDVVVINGAAAGNDGLDLGLSLKRAPATRHLPVILVGATPAAADSGATTVSVDEVVPASCRQAELVTRVHALVRLNTMRAELERRARTTAKYGLEAGAGVAPPSDVSDAHVLVVRDGGGEAETVAKLLNGQTRLSFADTPFAALDQLNAQTYDAVVVMARGGDQEPLDLCHDIRSNTRLYNTPVLVIFDAEGYDDPELPYRRGASDVLYSPLEGDELRARTYSLVRLQRYRQAMLESYRETPDLATSDSLTGLYNHGFLHQHLTSQIADAERWGKHLSLGFFDIPHLEAINRAQGYAAGDRLLRQIGHMIARLVRGEDLAARHGGKTFCVVQPETPEEVAVVALNRIAGVIDHTEFALPDSTEPFMVKLKVGRAGLEPGDDAATLIARARDKLD
jgi:two-component system cell cycle response regulator